MLSLTQGMEFPPKTNLSKTDIPQRYDPQEAEPRWQKFWEEQKIYEYHPHHQKKTFSIDTPPPTVSGKMHLGHAFSYTQQDIIARYHRMKGENVFFPFGTDDNGLPTERLVEKSKNILSTQMPRAEFVRICNEFIAQEKPAFIQSWKDVGMSADFTRSYSTINRHCQITSQASFIDLFQKGRIYQQEAPGSYCVTCQTAIAQAEFESVEMTSHFNDILFTSGGKELVISTTRPELLPACVALFYHPDDERYNSLKGKYAKVPVFNQEVPLLADASVDKDKGTGLMMVCTFGDKEDVDKWFRFKLPLRVVLEKNGRMNELAGKLKGMKIKEARKDILEKLKEKNLLLKQTEISHAVNVHERCKTEIEFLKTKQWYIKILDKKEELLELANTISWHPPHMKVRYDHWVQNLNWDWCISRQRHFGIPIPVWRCARCQAYVLPELKDLPVDPSAVPPRAITTTIMSAAKTSLAKTPPTKRVCSCGSTAFIGEPDVLDTWATSSVAPEITSNWVHQGEYDFIFDDRPFSLRPQAHDIIRTWLFYTIVKSSFHHGRAPWKEVMISGHAQDPHGRKMSKSLGNIIEPQEMIKKFSADALRFWAAGSVLGDDLPFQEKDLLTGQRFAAKLWNAARFCLQHLEDFNQTKTKITEMMDRWLLSKLQKVIYESTASFEAYEYAKAKSRIEYFFWHDFCDNYLEVVKDRLYNPAGRGSAARESAQHTLHQALLTVLKIMAPIIPHVTEEIYHLLFAAREKDEKIGKKREEKKEKDTPCSNQHSINCSIHSSAWPQENAALIDESAELAGDVAVDIINAVRKWKSEQKVSLKEKISALTLVSSEQGFPEIVKGIKDDLQAVLNTESIKFSDKDISSKTPIKTAINIAITSENFGINIEIRR